MLLEKVYDDFVKHTGLIDSVYKTVFINISNVLNTVNSISWKYLTYSTDSDTTTYNFMDLKKVPRYVIELLRNVFMNYYTLPNNAMIEIGVTINDTLYKIVNSSKGTEIPDELLFISNYDLYNLFILDKPVYDLFGAFDEEFSFTKSFQTSVHDIFHPLKKKFEQGGAQELVRDTENVRDVAAEAEYNSVTLQNKIQDILKKLEEQRSSTESLIATKNKILTGVNSREAFLMDKDKYIIENKTLQENRVEYIERKNKLQNAIKEIDAELSDTVSSDEEVIQTSDEVTTFLVSKKVMFEKELGSVEESIRDFDNFINDLQTKIQDITTNLSQIETYTTNDLSTLDDKIKTANARQDDLYGILVGLETELKHQNKIAEDFSLTHEKANSYGDITIKNIENSAIVNHLATSLNPSSVTTVINYLRYYFSYHTTQISDDLITANKELEPHIAHAVACKLFLVRCFGLYFNQIFSAVDFADNRVAKIIAIVRD